MQAEPVYQCYEAVKKDVYKRQPDCLQHNLREIRRRQVTVSDDLW